MHARGKDAGERGRNNVLLSVQLRIIKKYDHDYL